MDFSEKGGLSSGQHNLQNKNEMCYIELRLTNIGKGSQNILYISNEKGFYKITNTNIVLEVKRLVTSGEY
jgi:hypothetical protein